MFLRKLSFENFKNYPKARVELNTRFTGLSGDNGAGKTNFLDAIHYLSIGKSYFNPIDRQNIHHEQTYFNLEGEFEKDREVQNIFCAFARGQKKVVKKNGVTYSRLADHVGSFPVVMVTPYDVQLINSGSEERRKFMDAIISQYDRTYLDHLIKYQRTLAQRNARLRKMAGEESFDRSLVEVYDKLLDSLGTYIFNKRKDFLKLFRRIFKQYYQNISGGEEATDIGYSTQLHERSLFNLLQENFTKDFYLQRTDVGIHKDDLDFQTGGFPLKKFGSQGQQKTFLLSLKLSQFDHLKEKKSFSPILLLDDIFERLDKKRVHQLIETITCNDGFNQVFLTDTSADRLKKTLKPYTGSLTLFHVEKGRIHH